MQGLIFDIKRYAIHDGPGIRLTFFLKGCPLSCWWCHNPESRSLEPEQITRIERIGDKEFRREETVGKYYTVPEIMAIIRKERIFIDQSGGGVTFSGGEPMQQAAFLAEALRACKDQGLHTAVDTSGLAAHAAFRQVMPYVDLFLFDIKHLDEDLHRKYTGVSNRLILENFRRIAEAGKAMMVRVPVIPGINDGEENLERLKAFLLKYQSPNIREVNLLPYHDITGKYRQCGQECKLPGLKAPTDEQMAAMKSFLEPTGIIIKIGG